MEDEAQSAWFHDNRSGCEKQTCYFERMRHLQAELLTVEHKNLISAMERLKQLTYPRRKPVVLNYVAQPKFMRPGRDTSIAVQQYIGRRSERRRYHHNNGNMTLTPGDIDEISSLGPTALVVSFVNRKGSNASGRNRYSQPIPKQQSLQCTRQPERGRTLSHLIANDAKTPLSGVLFPSLPCIPNVGHRTHIEDDNKLRIIELANREFQRPRHSAQSTVSFDRKTSSHSLSKVKEREHHERLRDEIPGDEGRNTDIQPRETSGSECEGCEDVRVSKAGERLEVETEKSSTEVRERLGNQAEDHQHSDEKCVPPPTRANSRHKMDIRRDSADNSSARISLHLSVESADVESNT